MHDLLGAHRLRRLACHLCVNALFGGLASFALWADYNANALFSNGGLKPHEIATALIVGGAGVSIVNGLVRQYQEVREARHEATEVAEDRTDWKAAFEDALEVVRELQATITDLEDRNNEQEDV